MFIASVSAEARFDIPQLRGVQPGMSETDLRSQHPFGAVTSSTTTVAGWKIDTFQPSPEYGVQVTVRDGIVSSIDFVLSPPRSPRGVVDAWKLGGVIPTGALPAGALIGPVISRRSEMARTSAGALLIFTPLIGEPSHTEARVERIRFFAPDETGSIDAPHGDASDERFGAVISAVPPQLARQLGLTDRHGVILTNVKHNLLIWHLGLESDDVVTEVNGAAIRDPQQFLELLSQGDLTTRHSLEVMRGSRHAMLDVQVPRALLDELRAAAAEQMGLTLPPDRNSHAADSHVVTFQGLKPGVTTQRELLSSQSWGRAQSRKSVTSLLTLWQYHVAGFEVAVAVWGDKVQTIDIVLNKGASIASAERLFGVTQPANSTELSIEMLAGQPVSADLQPRPYADKQIVFFVDHTSDRSVVRIIRLYADDDPGR